MHKTPFSSLPLPFPFSPPPSSSFFLQPRIRLTQYFTSSLERVDILEGLAPPPPPLNGNVNLAALGRRRRRNALSATTSHAEEASSDGEEEEDGAESEFDSETESSEEEESSIVETDDTGFAWSGLIGGGGRGSGHADPHSASSLFSSLKGSGTASENAKLPLNDWQAAAATKKTTTSSRHAAPQPGSIGARKIAAALAEEEQRRQTLHDLILRETAAAERGEGTVLSFKQGSPEHIFEQHILALIIKGDHCGNDVQDPKEGPRASRELRSLNDRALVRRRLLLACGPMRLFFFCSGIQIRRPPSRS